MKHVWRDLALAAGAAVLAVGGALTAPAGRTGLDAPGVLLLIVAGLALIARRRYPRSVLAIAGASLLAYLVLGYPGVGPALPVLIALYTTVHRGHGKTARAAIAGILVVGIVGDAIGSGARPAEVFQRWFLIIGWMVASSVMAEVTRQHRAYLEQVERRAEEAERTREETARRRAVEERLRIARELHDSLTHSISIIKVQAGVAVHLARKHDEPVPEALLAIQHASTDAMRELRNTLEVLRTAPDPLTTDDNGNGLAHLDRLAEGAQRSGLPVTVHTTGPCREVPPAVDETAYRIVQEALTNAARHAGPAEATVCVEFAATTLTIRVDDNGHGTTTAPVPGVGLTGMRERVTALGGSLRTGPRPAGGFTVEARLPLTAPPAPAPIPAPPAPVTSAPPTQDDPGQPDPAPDVTVRGTITTSGSSAQRVASQPDSASDVTLTPTAPHNEPKTVRT
ncbi:sensor histidine kinase [Dactylosporangium sp. NPDC000244]|uniref:sensor histidine kinase n=1 Tax=Dactylosporangium sp. NPDC000244 TaxID=3154365 RepID=UPI00331BC019